MNGRVLVVNCGSSSLKYRLVDVGAGQALAWGLAERVGQPSGRLTHSRPGEAPDVVERPLPDHGGALVPDIVNTVAITAIQAQNMEST